LSPRVTVRTARSEAAHTGGIEEVEPPHRICSGKTTDIELYSFVSNAIQFRTDKLFAKPLSVRPIEGTVEKQAEPKLGLAWVYANFANYSRREQRMSNVAH
jgi:hypothetical protein